MLQALCTLACAVCLLAPATMSFAQPAAGQIVGVVRDHSGGVVAGATVTISGAALVAPRTVLTNERGEYALDQLPAGRYVVVVRLSGFEPRTVEIDIGVGAAALDLVLALSSLSDTVTVTATKTGAADIQSTPVAVTVLSARMLEQLGLRTVEGLAGVVPSLTVSQQAGLAQITIRGIGTNLVLPGTNPSSTVHLDGVYLARPAMAFADFLNVERVEVLRGPQGTLYGRNSVGGTINIVTRQPANSVETSGRLTLGNYATLRAEGAITGPLVKDKVMGSFAFIRGSRRGFVNNLAHPDDSLGSEDTWAGRAQLRVVLGTHGEILLSGDVGRFAGIPLTYAKPIATKPGFDFDHPPSLWAVRTSHLAAGANMQRGVSTKLILRVNDTTTLTNLTAYRQSNHRFFIDADLTELTLQTNDIRDLQHQFSEELTLVRRTPKLVWIGGLYFFDEHDRAPVMITLYNAGTENRPDSTIDARASAVFGQATYQVSDRVSVTGGVRYTDERKDLDNMGGVYRIRTTRLADPTSLYAFVDRASYDAWTPKVSIQGRATPDTFFYISAARGFKSGGFNPSWPAPGRSYSPEFAWSFESGLKRSMAGGRVRGNTAVFFGDYKDLQVQSFIRPGLLDISNAASANVRGVEVEAAAAAGRLQFAGSLSWLDATYDGYDAAGAGGVIRNATGNRLNNAPEWSGSVSAFYEFAAGRSGTASVRGDVSWQSRVFFTPFNDDIETQKPYGLVNLRAGFEPRHRRWEFAIYARNIGNKEYITGTASFPLPAIGGRPGEPRHWGTQITLRR